MQILKIPVSEINPAPHNPRKNLQQNDSEYKQIEASINGFGLVEPLIWNKRTKNLVGGHQRLKVLVSKGCKEIEVSVVDLDLEKEKALNLALNKVQGAWDKEKLAVLLDEMIDIPDFNIESIGFNKIEISQLFDNYLDSKEEDDFDFISAVESIKTPITQKGDIIELGMHRVMCGDSASESDLDKLMQGRKIDLIHTDPPYGCSYLAQNRPDLTARPKKSKRWEKLYKDDLNEKEYEVWIESVLRNIKRYLKDGAVAYIWNGHAKFYFVHQVLKGLGFHISTVITLAKPTFGISYGDFNQQTEFCIYSWLKNAPHKWYGPANESNLWEIPRDKVAELIHPTQKNVQIPARAIRNSSARNDIVFDGFLGSGSTLMAAESLKRRCLGLEIEPKYCDAIVRRYIAYVGKDKVSSDLIKRYAKEE